METYKTISLQITEEQERKLAEIKRKVGIPRASMVRRAIDLYLHNIEKYGGDVLMLEKTLDFNIAKK